MGRRRAFDLDEALASATRLFWQGYDTASLADLTSAMGIVASSFYFAFQSKEALFRQVVDRYVAAQAEAFERAFRATTTAGGIEALLRDYADVVTDPAHTPGCLVVNNMPSVDATGTLQPWLAGLRQALRARLAAQFTADVTNGRLPPDADPEAMAQLVATLAGGLAVEARSGASRQELHAAVSLALRSIGPAQGRAAPGSPG